MHYPGELLTLAAEKGEIHAIADGDPKAFFWLRDGELRSGRLEPRPRLREPGVLHRRPDAAASCVTDQPIASALTRALLEAQDLTVAKPELAARAFLPQAPKDKTEQDMVGVLLGQTHNHNPVGSDLKQEIALYAQELRDVQRLQIVDRSAAVSPSGSMPTC